MAGEYQKQQFGFVLSKQAYHSVSEGHLWFSIFSRPPSQRFTRVQRCTCCFVLLLTSMLLNILYYDQTQESKSNNSTTGGLALGTIHITPQQVSGHAFVDSEVPTRCVIQIGIGIIVEVLAFVPSLLLVQCFRRIRSRALSKKVTPLIQTLATIKQKPVGYRTVPVGTAGKKKGKPFSLPWWCLFVAYGFSLLLATVAVFFIIVRGIQFGDSKTQKWLVSSVTSFFSSVLLTQPVKVRQQLSSIVSLSMHASI